jgi:hypothetical protein
VTPKKESGLTEACVNGKPMLIFVRRNLETEKILIKKIIETANEILTSPCRPDMTSDFGAPQQPIGLFICCFEGGVILVEGVSSGM